MDGQTDGYTTKSYNQGNAQHCGASLSKPQLFTMILHHTQLAIYTIETAWLLSACAYNMRQQENMRLIKSMRSTGSMCLIESAKTR